MKLLQTFIPICTNCHFYSFNISEIKTIIGVWVLLNIILFFSFVWWFMQYLKKDKYSRLSLNEIIFEGNFIIGFCSWAAIISDILTIIVFIGEKIGSWL